MTVQCPPVFRPSCMAIIHVSSSLAIFLLFSVLCCPLYTFVLRRPAVCNTAELMLCWCVLTICVRGSALLSVYYTSFVIPLGRLLTASGPFLPVFWEHTSDLHLPLGDAVCGWLAVSSFSCLVFAVLGAKTVSKCQ